MTFSEGGSFEGGRVRTRRGGARGVAIGGGLGGLLIAVLYLVLGGGSPDDVLSGLSGGQQGAGGAGGSLDAGVIEECSVEDANSRRDCRLSATVQALDAYWEDTLADTDARFAIPEVVSFAGATDTACGAASSSTGPFYCPPDATIYIDLGFYDLLTTRFGATGGPLAELYVTAHEYGHHVQALLGTLDAADRSATGAQSHAVRTELQADCYAGMWVGAAATQVDPDRGVTFLEPITADQLAQALSAAEAVGDDHIQAASGGAVNPDSWTHGSSEQRQHWFTIGYNTGMLAACDTFTAEDL